MTQHDGKVREGQGGKKTKRLNGGAEDRYPGAISRGFPGVSRVTYFGLGSATTVGYIVIIK